MPIDKTSTPKRTESKRRAMEGFLRTHRNEPLERIMEPKRISHQREYYSLAIGICLILLSGAIFFGLKAMRNSSVESKQSKASADINLNPWYSIKLADGEVVYGKIKDINQDPLVIDPAYYNYDQKKDKPENATAGVNESGDLRLVKRGGETHGPDGALKVFRTQTVYLENLRADSKVLKVILENEK